MDGFNIDDLTIEQCLRLTQEHQTPSMVMKFDDMTIAEYIEYEERIKRQYNRNFGSYFPTYFGHCTSSNNTTLEFPRNTYFNPIPPNTNFNYDSKDTELDEEAGYTINEESVMSEHEAINPVHTVNTQYFEEELSSEEDLDEWLNAKMEKHITNIDASNNVMPRSINEYMKLANLGGAAMSVEMDDMTQQETLETMKNRNDYLRETIPRNHLCPNRCILGINFITDEESARRSAEMKEWFMKLQENAEINTRNQSASLKNLETQIEQLTKELNSRTTNVAPSSSTGQCKVVNNDHETQHKPISSRKLNNKEGWMTKDTQCQLPPKELNPGSFTLSCTIGNFNFYGMVDLDASVNVMPRNTFEHLRLANLRNTNMLVEMADMTKKAPLGIIENILVRINKFLFPLDFVIIDKTPNETIILGRPFLATIHVEIDVFDKKNSLGVDNARVSYDMEKKDHNFTTPTEKIFMIKSDLENRPQSPVCSDNESRNLPNRSPNDSQGSQSKKIKLDQHIPRAHFCKPIKQTIDEKTMMWPTCDPNKSMKYQNNSLVWGDRYAEWCNVSPTPGNSSQESNNLRPRDNTFREWTLIKIRHTDISELVKKALLKLWLIDCFQDELRIIKDPHSQSFYDYKWAFDLEIDHLADEYKLGIRKKGHMLDKIWEYCKDVHRDNTYWRHDHGFEKEECDEIKIEIEKYYPPEVQVETFDEVDTNKRKDKEKGVVEVDDDLKKPYKEVLESLFTRRIIEFSAPTEQVLPIGKIELEVVFGNEGLSRRTMMKFKVVETSSPYNIILGRTRMRELCVVSSTTHAMMKFPTPRGIATLVPRKDAIFDCRQIEDRQVSPGESPEEKTGEKKEESSTEDVMINPAFPDQRVAIGTQFSSTCRNCNTPKIR
ncbi:reverse transcriptase domain-containing protein [Tanacetum coccineum]